MPFSFRKRFGELIPQRWIIAVMGFFAFVNAYTLRVCLSMAITQMVKPTNSSGANVSGEYLENESCPEYDAEYNVSGRFEQTTAFAGTFEWSEYTQGIILSAFYWGYAITHVPGGLLATRYGPKLTIGLGVLFTAVLTILTPISTTWGGSSALITVRFLMGLCEGVIQPGMSCLLAQWIPARERSTSSSWTYNGVRFGVLVSNVCSGLIMHGAGDNSWPYVFYLFGCAALLWYLLWHFLCYDSPRGHPYLVAGERAYLERELGDAVTHAPKPAFPWRHALTSPPFVALILMQCGHDWGTYTIMSDLPKYMKSVLKLPVWLNGYASSMYNLTGWLVSFLMSWLSDWLISSGLASRTQMRKTNAAISSLVPGIMMVVAMYVGCDVVAAVALVTIGLTFEGCAVPGIKVNPMDLSPNYAGTLMGISNGVGAIMGIFAPYTVGVLAPNQSLAEWRLVFWVAAAVYLVTSLNFCIFASGDVQPWNNPAFLESEKKRRQGVDDNADQLMLNNKKHISA